jgi:hypothetical protein
LSSSLYFVPFRFAHQILGMEQQQIGATLLKPSKIPAVTLLMDTTEPFLTPFFQISFIAAAMNKKHTVITPL